MQQLFQRQEMLPETQMSIQVLYQGPTDGLTWLQLGNFYTSNIRGNELSLEDRNRQVQELEIRTRQCILVHLA